MLSFFDSKNKKMVKKWQGEHARLVEIGQKVIAEYVKNNESEAKRALKRFVDLAMDHLTSEDVEFFKMIQDGERADEQTEKLIAEFQRTFKDTKTTLMKFLAKYVKPEVGLDDEFFDTFSTIMDILGKRISYEEENLYFRMSLS